MSRLSLFDAMKAAGIDPETAPMRHAAAPPIRKDNLMSDAVMVPTIDYEVWQNGDMVASASNLSDAQHYMAVYGQDGPVEARTNFSYQVPGFTSVPPLAASTPVGGWERRVDLNNGGTLEDGGHVDDLSISGEHISLLRLERMSRGSFWGRIYMKDGQDIVLSVSAPKGKVDVTAEADAAPPPPSVSIDNGSRPQEAVPTEQAEPAVVGDDGWTEWKGGKNPVPGEVVEARFAGGFVSEALDSESFGWDRHNDPVIAPMYDIVAYRVVPQPADGCSSNEGAGGWIAHVGTPNPAPGKHVRARFRSGAEVDGAADGFEWGHWPCDGDIMAYRILPQTEKGS